MPLPAPHDKQFYTVEDLNVGRQVQLYSKVFKITVSCSAVLGIPLTTLHVLYMACCIQHHYYRSGIVYTGPTECFQSV